MAIERIYRVLETGDIDCNEGDYISEESSYNRYENSAELDYDDMKFGTTDGELFETEELAEVHEATLTYKDEVRDLLNQVVILSEKYKNDSYMGNISSICKRITSESSAQYNEYLYYNSNC